MKTCVAFCVLLAVSLLAYVYAQHPEWLPKQLQLGSNKPEVPVTPSTTTGLPVVVLQPVATHAPQPVPVKIVKVWEKPSDSTVYPSDWILVDGTQYHKVKVLSVDPDAVNIMHEDGACLVDDTSLSPDLQKLVNYDPDLAKAAATKRKSEQDQSDQAFIQSQAATPTPNPAPIEANQNIDQGPNRADQIAQIKAQIANLLQEAEQADDAQQSAHQTYNLTHPGNITIITIDAGDSYRRQAAALRQQLNSR